jgi:hypothetical protein
MQLFHSMAKDYLTGFHDYHSRSPLVDDSQVEKMRHNTVAEEMYASAVLVGI